MKKLLLTMIGAIMAFAVNAADWYISGAFQGWQHCAAAYKFTETDPGVFVYQVPEGKALSGEFLIVQGTPGTPNWGSKIGTNGSKVKEGIAYSYRAGADNFSMDGSVAEATVTLDTNARTLLVTGKAAENDYTNVYLVGDMGGGWNDSRTDFPMELKAGTNNVWVATYTLSAANSYFKMRAGDYQYGTGGQDITVELGKEYTCPQGGNSFVLPAGKYNFNFVLDKNADTGVLTVTADGPVTYPETIYVIGHINNLEFLPNNTQALESTGEGTYKGDVTFTGTMATGYSYFQICTSTGSTTADWAGLGTRYGAAEENLDPTTGIMTLTGNDLSWKVADGTYTIEVNLVDKTMTVTPKDLPTPPTPPTPDQPLDVTFVFNTAEGLSALTPAIPSYAEGVEGWEADGKTGNYQYVINEKTYTKDGIAMSALRQEGSSKGLARIYYQSTGALTMRTYAETDLTLAAPEGYAISKVVYTSDKANNNKLALTTGMAGTLEADGAAKTWTADTPMDKVIVTSTGTTRILTINVILVKADQPTPPQPDVPDAIYYSGNLGGSWEFNFKTVKNETKFTATFEVTAKTGYITITSGEMANWSVAEGVRYGAGTADVAIESGVAYEMTEGSDKCWTMGAGTYDMTVDFATEKPTVTFTLTETPPTPPTPEFPVLYLRGAFTGDNWGATELNKFTVNEGVYTLQVESLAGEFKISDADWADDNTYSTGNTAMELDTEYTCLPAGSGAGNMGMATPVTDATVTFDYNTKKLTITGTPVTEIVVTYVIHTNIASTDPTDWKDFELTSVTRSGETLSCDIPAAVSEGEMLVIRQENGVNKDYYKAPEASSLAPQGTVVLSTANTENIAMADLIPGYIYTYSFDPENSVLAVNDGTTGIEGIEADKADAPVYYNLQGVRVDNPATGMYIVVRGSVSTKEYVR